ncbi:MAG TPA: PepSY domain-containing protein [Stenotrophomonas sp.]|nr:PepSY domain-containing protein [Stenotrophomonas sp.]
MKAAFRARSLHKWIGLIMGVQALLWMISGVYMTVVPLEIIHGDHLAHVRGKPLQAATARIEADALHQRYPGLTALKLKRLLGREVYELQTGGRSALVDAATGAQISPLERADAIAVATALYQGDGVVRAAELVTRAPQEVVTRPVPMWAVHFADRGQTTLYLSPDNGELLARRHSLWRWFDFLWMFHIMDYDTRSDVNNPLLRVAAISGLLFVLSGAWLLYFSFRRRPAR